MRKAEEAAQRVGEGRNDFHTEFGPTNVALHAVSVSVELGDAGEALRRAATVDASGLSTERRASLLIDVARACGQRQKTPEAVQTLKAAESLTPEQHGGHRVPAGEQLDRGGVPVWPIYAARSGDVGARPSGEHQTAAGDRYARPRAHRVAASADEGTFRKTMASSLRTMKEHVEATA